MSWPVELCLIPLNDANRRHVSFGIQLIDVARRSSEIARTSNSAAVTVGIAAASAFLAKFAAIPIIATEHPAILGVDRNSMGIRQLGHVAANRADGFVLTGALLLLHHNHGGVLHGEVHLFFFFVHGDAVGAVWGAQFTGRGDIAFGLAVEDH